MQPRFPLDRARLTPIILGIVLILGLGGILSACGPVKPSITMTATATHSSLRPLETATLALSYTAPPLKDEALPTATGTGPNAYPAPSTEATPSATLFITETLPPPSDTPTPDFIQPLRGGKYDDVDPNIAYDPYWVALKNQSTASAYLGTIHASNNAGSEASFRFKGKRFSLGYKRGRGFGTVTVLVDGQSYSFQEEAFDLVWNSPTLSSGDHFVRIIHDSGQAVNLDYILIVE
jgi:hypothetical protein